MTQPSTGSQTSATERHLQQQVRTLTGRLAEAKAHNDQLTSTLTRTRE